MHRFAWILIVAAACGSSSSSSQGAAGGSAAATFDAAPPPAVPVPFWGVADLHVDLPFMVHYKNRIADLSKPGGQVTAQSLRAGCVRLLVLSIYTPSGMDFRRHTMTELKAIIDTADDIVDVNKDLLSRDGGPILVVYGIEGAQALVGHADDVPGLVARGVKLVGLVHTSHNDLADSATDLHPGHGGLTDEGKKIARAVYEAGGLIDVSHMSDQSFNDVAAIAKELGKPIVATHSNARALADAPRNLTDDELRAIADSGGIVGINFHSPFIRGDGGTATIEGVVQHILYIRDLIGIEHLAIGSDLDGQIVAADGLESHAGIGDLVRALRKAGVSTADQRLLLGENVRRVLFGLEPAAGVLAPVPADTCKIDLTINPTAAPATE